MLSHSSGALLALVGLVALLRRAKRHGMPWRARACFTVYALSLCFAFTASALFHYFPWSPEKLIFFKKLDHAAIFVLMAGTCTVLLYAGRSSRRGLLVAACWIVSLAALVLKMAYWPMSLWMSAAVYLSVGWVAAASVLSALRHVAWDDLRHLIYGVIVLSAAAVVFATELPVLWPGVVEGHELFHLLVLAGVALHFRFVFGHCALPAGETSQACMPEPVSLAADPRGS